MVSRRSLRKKLAYTFLAGALITTALFFLTIAGILTDYFSRQSVDRQQLVQEQATLAVRGNLVIFKDRLQQLRSGALNLLSRTGTFGDRFDRLARSRDERESAAKHLQAIQFESRLSFITIVDKNGKVVLRSTNPTAVGDDTFMRSYVNSSGPLSSIANLVQAALSGKTISSFEVFAPEIMALENVIENGKAVTSWKDYTAIPTFQVSREDNWNRVMGPVETRVLTLTLAQPILNSRGDIVGAAIAGKVINKDIPIVQDFRNVSQDHASVFLGQVRITSTLKQTQGEHKGESMIGGIYPDATRTSIGLYVERLGRYDGEPLMGVFDPIKNHEGTAVGAIYIGRPLSALNEITKAQDEIQAAVQRRTIFSIIALVVCTMLLALVMATVFSKRMIRHIDKLRKGAETISDGNLDHRLDIQSGDEIEVLAQQFNSMAAKLQESHQNMEKKVEERTRELKESQETMVQQEKMVGIGQLAAGIAHEMNTPLGTIIGYAQMLREDLAAQPSANGNLNDVDEIIEQAGRCRDLVKNLLNFSRRSTTEKSEADLNAIVRKILSLVEHDFDLKRVRVQATLDPELPKVKVNENEIAQVVLNLANNAVDSMPDGGNLILSTFYEEETDRIRIEVRDTGFGIAESDRTRVFEPFFTTKEVGKGTGLGLSICYKIIENHMGSMEFDSVTGRGTTFRVYIPVNAEVRVG